MATQSEGKAGSTEARPRRRIVLRLIVLASVMAISGALVFGYLGWIHAAFDAFSHFRIHLAVILAMMAIPLMLLRFWPEAMLALALGSMATFQTIGLPSASANADPQAGTAPIYRLLQLNLRFDNVTPEAVLSLVGRLRPDIATLNEVSQMWVEKLKLLEPSYPYQIICKRPIHVGGVAILSRRPFVDGTSGYCGRRSDFALAHLDMGGRKLELAALHIGWPWPFEQRWQIGIMEGELQRIGDTAIIAGDLNAVPWSQTARRVAAGSDAHLLRGIGPTWLDRRMPQALRGLIGLPLDNVMVKGGVVALSAATTESAGSDHLPVLVEFSLLPQERAAEVRQAMAGR